MTNDEFKMMRINPNHRLVALMDFAVDQIVSRLSNKDEFAEWLAWASSWKDGERSPARCVSIAHRCFEHKGWDFDGEGADPVWHCLGQLAWGAKETCYSTPTGGWLTVRYIADAMIAFGIAFPDKETLLQPLLIDVVEKCIGG